MSRDFFVTIGCWGREALFCQYLMSRNQGCYICSRIHRTSSRNKELFYLKCHLCWGWVETLIGRRNTGRNYTPIITGFMHLGTYFTNVLQWAFVSFIIWKKSVKEKIWFVFIPFWNKSISNEVSLEMGWEIGQSIKSRGRINRAWIWIITGVLFLLWNSLGNKRGNAISHLGCWE